MQTETSTITPYGKIYRLTNKVNGKMYHGQSTEENINDRWKRYKNLNCKCQKKLYPALKKYGWNNFLAEVIDTTPQNQSQLDDLEISYIAKFDSMNNGYNCNKGGSGNKGNNHSELSKTKISNALKGNNNPNFGKHHSEETKRSISSALIGRIMSIETRKKMSDSRKGKNNPNFKKSRSEEIKLKISESLKKFNSSRTQIP